MILEFFNPFWLLEAMTIWKPKMLRLQTRLWMHTRFKCHQFHRVKSKHKYSPVIITNAARQANKEMSKFIRCRLLEKSMMESIQSPKLWMHCSRWRTTPLQKISLFFSGFDLQLSCSQHTQEGCELLLAFVNKAYLYASRRMKSSTKADSRSSSWSSLQKSVNPGTISAQFLITSKEPVSRS